MKHRKLEYAPFIPRNLKAIFAQRFVITCCNESCSSSRKDRGDNATPHWMTQYIMISIYHSAHALQAMQIQRIYSMPQLIEYVEEHRAYNKTRREWRALEDHLEFITVRQCVNTRRENDKQHSAERAFVASRHTVGRRSPVLESAAGCIALSSRADLFPAARETITRAAWAMKAKGMETREDWKLVWQLGAWSPVSSPEA